MGNEQEKVGHGIMVFRPGTPTVVGFTLLLILYLVESKETEVGGDR